MEIGILLLSLSLCHNRGYVHGCCILIGVVIRPETIGIRIGDIVRISMRMDM
jgi:hypothetical protein